MRSTTTVCAFLFGLLVASASAQRTVLVDRGAEWNYLGDGTDQGTAWREPGFDDSTWPSGAAPLGFGDASLMTDIGRLPTRITSYFRKEFEVSAVMAENVKRLVIDLRRDDGAVVYLNGIEFRRDNLPEGEISSETTTLTAVAGADEAEYIETVHPAEGLVAGTNTLAVEVHNSLLGSIDLILDLSVRGDETLGSFGNSRPPCMIDFETGEFSVEGGLGVGVRRRYAPDYTGLEYHYDQVGGRGDVFRSANEVFGPALGTTVLAAYSAGFSFETLPIDVQNYTDVSVAFDLRTEGSIADPPTKIAATLSVAEGFGIPETLAWLEIVPTPPGPGPESLFPEDAAIRYQVPTDPQIPIAEWTQEGFDDSAWSAGALGIGYERSGDPGTFDPFLGSDVETEMYNINASVNFRVPFTLTAEDLDAANRLFLDMRYDDGFVAWLNGTEIGRKNAPDPLQWNSPALGTHPDIDAIEYEREEVAAGPGLLHVGPNVLAVRGLNTPSGSSDFLIQPQLLLEKAADVAEESLEYFRGEFKTVQTEPGFIGDGVSSVVLHIDAEVASSDEPIFYIDNIVVTGIPIEPDSFTTATALDPGLDGIDVETNPDPEGDGLSLLLEYAFGGSFLQIDDPQSLLPQVGYDELGFMIVQFRMLDGRRLGDAESGYDVADLRYTPQLSYDLLNWRDGSGVPPFEQIGEILTNGDGTVTVTMRSRRRLQVEHSRAYFRVLVEVARPPQVVLTDSGS